MGLIIVVLLAYLTAAIVYVWRDFAERNVLRQGSSRSSMGGFEAKTA